jgi:hypothetical protein
VTSNGNSITDYSCLSQCRDGTYSSGGDSVSIKCCITDFCNTVLETNGVVSRALSTLALALIISGSVIGFCLLVCFIICISAIIYLCCFKDRSQGNSNPPSVYIVGPSQMGHLQHQQQLQMQYQKQIPVNSETKNEARESSQFSPSSNQTNGDQWQSQDPTKNTNLRESSQSSPPSFHQENNPNNHQPHSQHSHEDPAKNGNISEVRESSQSGQVNYINTQIAHAINPIEESKLKNNNQFQSGSTSAITKKHNSNFDNSPANTNEMLKGSEEPDDYPYFDKYYGGHKSNASDSESDQIIENGSNQFMNYKKGLRRIPYL